MSTVETCVFDTETFGFNGPIVIIQYQFFGEEPKVHNVWNERVGDTLDLMHRMIAANIVGFNLAFDWYQLQKMYNMLVMFQAEYGPDAQPIAYVSEIAHMEPDARTGQCIKPPGACDLMLYARSGPYQSTMGRKEIRIRRVPKLLAFKVRNRLENVLDLPAIYFHKNATGQRWNIYNIKNFDGTECTDFVDIALRFNPSSALKAIIVDAGLREDRLTYEDIRIQAPAEVPYAPWALAISEGPYWASKVSVKATGSKTTWPAHVDRHCSHWAQPLPFQYALDDVIDTHNLYNYFSESIEMPWTHVDSNLACMVGSERWKGFAVDVERLKVLRTEALTQSKKAPTAPKNVFAYLAQVLDEEELNLLKDQQDKTSTSKIILENLKKMKKECSCVTTVEVDVNEDNQFVGFGGVALTTEVVRQAAHDCTICTDGKVAHPVAERAEKVLSARQANTKKALYNKLIKAGRMHPAASVIGSLSGRVSGASEGGDGDKVSAINALGIQREKTVRKAFPLADPEQVMCGGDFSGFEVSIADALWGDETLRTQLLTCNTCEHRWTPDQFRQLKTCPGCGEEDSLRKIHALFALEVFVGMTYNQIMETKGLGDGDLYDRAKRGVFALLYGGDGGTLARRVGIDKEDGERAITNFFNRYEGIRATQQEILDRYCALTQPEVRGMIHYKIPENKVATILGFERDFSLENKVVKTLYDMGHDPPKEWLNLKIKVKRRDREQDIGGAVRTAIFAAAFGLQGVVQRAATNHPIQGSGAEQTKRLQYAIWCLQPAGVHDWVVQPFQVHDEIITPCDSKETQATIRQIVYDFVEELKKIVPLIKIDWSDDLKDWSEK